MKKLLLSLITIILSITCNAQPKINKTSLGLFYLLINRPIETSCVTSRLNPSYYFENYYPTYSSDKNKYGNVVIGDSSIDIPFRNGFNYDRVKTKMVAVSGNTLCDINAQFDSSVLLENSPNNFILGTLGGNDLLNGVNDENVFNNFKFVLNKIKEKNISGKLVLIGTHPTLINSINLRKDLINLRIKQYSENHFGENKVCYIEPMDILGTSVDSSKMMDNIHLRAEYSIQIFNLIPSKCGVTL